MDPTLPSLPQNVDEMPRMSEEEELDATMHVMDQMGLGGSPQLSAMVRRITHDAIASRNDLLQLLTEMNTRLRVIEDVLGQAHVMHLGR